MAGWTCKACTFQNTPTALVCPICNTDKDGPARTGDGPVDGEVVPEGMWKCARCTLHNENTKPKCGGCFGDAPADVLEALEGIMDMEPQEAAKKIMEYFGGKPPRSADDLTQSMQRHKSLAAMLACGGSADQVKEAFVLLDLKKTGDINLDDLTTFCHWRRVFNKIDEDRSAFITKDELSEGLTKPDIRKALNVAADGGGKLYRELDTDGQGCITWSQFYRYFSRLQAAAAQPAAAGAAQQPAAVNPYLAGAGGGAARPNTPPPARPPPKPKPGHILTAIDPSHQIQLYETDGRTKLKMVPSGEVWQISREDQHWYCVKLPDGAGPGKPKDAFIQKRQVKKSDQPGNVWYNQKYQLVKKLGEGAFGDVMLCKDLQGFEVVLKKPKMASGVLPEEVEQERNIMQQLKHKHIIRLIDSFEEPQGILNIVSEFAEGGDLRGMLKRHPQGIPEADTIRLTLELADAMAYLHGLRPVVLHRDLKPDNILLTLNKSVKLADLGLARNVEQGKQALTYCGTPNYMAPEIQEQKPYAAPADMFSVGCVLYEFATARLAFAHVAAIVRGDVPGDTPAYCKSHVENLLQRDPRMRMTAVHLMHKLQPGQPPARGGYRNPYQ